MGRGSVTQFQVGKKSFFNAVLQGLTFLLKMPEVISQMKAEDIIDLMD